METVKTLYIGEKKKPHQVLRFPFVGIEGAYIVLSYRSERIALQHVDIYVRYREPYCPTEAVVSFFFAGPNKGAEWNPGEKGPLMVYRKCGPDWTGTSFGGHPLKAKEHWFYDYVQDDALSWSQLAVNNERLPQKLADGDFAGIFHSLRSWSVEDDDCDGRS